MEKVITQCPHCQSKFRLGGEKVGKKIRCPKCKEVFVVQEAALKAKPAAPKTASAPQPTQPPTAPPPPVVETPPAPPVQEPPAAPEKQDVVPLKERPHPLQVKDFFETQHLRFLPEKAEGVDAHISYEITGEGGGKWSLKVKNGTCDIREGGDPTAKSHAKMTAKTYLKLAQGKLDGRVAFMLGKIRIKGDKSSLATVRECFQVPEV